MRSHRLLPFATLLTLALTTVATSTNAQSQSAESTLPYVYSHNTFPSERASVARHTLRFAIPANSKSVSALKLTAPAGFTLSQKVAVLNNKTGESLPVNVSIAGQTVELSFNRAVEPGTAIDVELNNVGVWGTDRHYDLAVKFASENRNANGSKLQVANARYVNLGRTGLRRS
jgi:autotransporter translocation and assembly factor TamB